MAATSGTAIGSTVDCSKYDVDGSNAPLTYKIDASMTRSPNHTNTQIVPLTIANAMTPTCNIVLSLLSGDALTSIPDVEMARNERSVFGGGSAR